MAKKINKKKSTQDDPVESFISSYFEEIKRSISAIKTETLSEAVNLLIKAYKQGKKIYIIGNGGSSSVASHMACDLGKGTLTRMYDVKEKRMKVISLTDNTSLITAYANDIGYDSIFLQQLQNLIEKGDVLISISGSGNSQNILKAVKYARKIGAVNIGLTGFNKGGKLAKIVDLPIIVQSNHYGPIEDIHLMIGHILTASVANLKKKENGGKIKSPNKSVPYK